MCVPVKTGSELVQKRPAAQAKFSVDTQDKRSCILAVTRPWKYWILNKKPLLSGRKSDRRNSSESYRTQVLTTRDLPVCWGRAATADAGTNPTQGNTGTKYHRTCSWQTHQPGCPALVPVRGRSRFCCSGRVGGGIDKWDKILCIW